MNDRIYINDFCEDLNYRGAILYIGLVDHSRLLHKLKESVVNKTYRLDYAVNAEEPAKRNFIYVENCDLQNLDWPVYEYMEDGYDVYVLYEDGGKYYVKQKL